MKNKANLYLQLFLTMLKIGAFTFLGGVRPCIVAMILATSITIGLSTLF